VVEVAARVGSQSVEPLPVPPLDAVARGLVAHVSAYEELALEAALHGGRERVFRALVAHPLVGRRATAETLADLLIDANRSHLPWA
jgi:6-phospho-beta-glucosidase